MATALLAALLGGCSFLSKEADATEVSSEAETESPGATQEPETARAQETQENNTPMIRLVNSIIERAVSENASDIHFEPTAEELADIAVASAETARVIAGIEPKVAMLSFSTKGSGNDSKFYDTVSKVQKAAELAKAAAPGLELDGEFQFDAAVAPEVGSLKAPGSSVAGHANTFIFPNINAGNIGYKICARMGGWKAIGPVCQGFARPLNDLSRGCNVDEIIDTVAVTALQA